MSPSTASADGMVILFCCVLVFLGRSVGILLVKFINIMQLPLRNITVFVENRKSKYGDPNLPRGTSNAPTLDQPRDHPGR
jgi:hypothetical protein